MSSTDPLDASAVARRWQLIALATAALLVGYISGSLSPNAGAQPAVTKVQLDTSNCTVGVSTFSSEREGSFVVQVGPSAVQGVNTYVFNTCR